MPRRLEEMSKIQEGLLQDMQSLIEEQMPALEAQYRADVNEWEKQHDIWKASNPEAAASSSAGPSLPAEAHEEGAGGNGSTLQPGERKTTLFLFEVQRADAYAQPLRLRASSRWTRSCDRSCSKCSRSRVRWFACKLKRCMSSISPMSRMFVDNYRQ